MTRGPRLAVALCSLGSRKKKWAGVIPWLQLKSKPEREAFEQRIARFKPTLRNISVAARFTRADREKYAKAEGVSATRSSGHAGPAAIAAD